MSRPRKPRIFEDTKLADNLYPDPNRRAGKWRYVRPDGTSKIFSAETIHEANQLAEAANAERDTYCPTPVVEQGLTIIGGLVEDYISKRLRDDPELRKARSWANRAYALRKFGRELDMPPTKLKRVHITSWWDGLTYNQQKLRHAEFRKAFNYWLGRGLFRQFEYNPFTTADDRPRLYLKAKPARSRLRLDIKSYWRIYNAAGELGYEGLQIAMGISLLTFMREGDILNLRFDENFNGDQLKTIISKSAAQKGHTKATRLQWNTEKYGLLKELINKARALGLRNINSPYLVSYISKRRDRDYRSRLKKHKGQMTKERLCEQFAAARDATKLYSSIPNGKTPPTFHEIRSLADALAKTAGYEISAIQTAMAHSDEAMTMQYMAEHDLPHDVVDIVLSKELLGGSF
ncbi:MAG: integrase [Flavobacteriales bacterium]|jgi:integrase